MILANWYCEANNPLSDQSPSCEPAQSTKVPLSFGVTREYPTKSSLVQVYLKITTPVHKFRGLVTNVRLVVLCRVKRKSTMN